MTNVTGFDELTDSDDEDLLGIIDDPNGIPKQKKITGINYRGALMWKNPVRVASTANLTLSGEQTVDGISTSTDRILVKDQSTGSENGVYVTASGSWVRSDDFNTDNKATGGAFVTVQEGTANADKLFQLTTVEPITLDTTALVFAELGGGGGGDDLGDHTATQDLDMDIHAITFADDADAPAVTVPYITHVPTSLNINENVRINLQIAGAPKLTLEVGKITSSQDIGLSTSKALLLDNVAAKSIRGVTGGNEYSTESGLEHIFRVLTTIEYTMSATQFDMKNNKLIMGSGIIQFEDVDMSIQRSLSDLQFDVDNNRRFEFRVNNILEIEMEDELDLNQNTILDVGGLNMNNASVINMGGSASMRFNSNFDLTFGHTGDSFIHDVPDAKSNIWRANNINMMVLDQTDGLLLAHRLQQDKGADQVAATTVTLGNDGNYFDITGSTQIDAITSTNWQPGSVIILQFDASVTLGHNVGADGFFLAGAGNASMTADDTITLVWDSARWRELARSVN